MRIQRTIAICAVLSIARVSRGSGHGPIFALATPTSPRGGWSFDTSVMGRYGHGGGAMYRGTLGYGLTEDLKVSVSAPVVFRAEPFPPSRTSSLTPMGGNFEGLALWRFHRNDFGVGSRFETTAVGGVLIPGPQEQSGELRGIRSGPGVLAGIVTGIASRSHYVWVGGSYQRYAPSHQDQRPDLWFFSAAYAYRPPSWRKDHGWDWRIFVEGTGERGGGAVRSGVRVPDSRTHQIFVGPTTLGVYKNYAVSGGIQYGVFQAGSTLYPRERIRVALDFTLFF